jgi:hypothetical protein
MRNTMFSGLVLLLFTTPLKSQTAFFPLHIGDTWQYFQIVDPNPLHPIVDTQQTTVVGDTLMPNGRHYAVIHDWSAWSYMRQQGDSVFVWSSNSEKLYFDFSRIPGDTTFTNIGEQGNTVFIITESRDTSISFFGHHRWTWSFIYNDPNMIDEERIYNVVDSIGIVNIYYPTWGPWNFQGARVNGVVYGTLTSVEPTSAGIPAEFRLEQNFPNPFNPFTIIKYTVGGNRGEGVGARWVSLIVYDLLGREVATLVNEPKAPGSYEVPFYGSKLASGVYLCVMHAGNFSQTRKICLIR